MRWHRIGAYCGTLCLNSTLLVKGSGQWETVMETLLTVDQAAKVLGISPWTVRKLLYIKRLPSIRICRRVLIEPREIQRLIEEGRTELTQDVKEAR